jgi:hypothetical protein
MVLACPAGIQVMADCMESIARRRAFVGGERCAAIVVVSWSWMYLFPVRSLCSAYSVAARRYLRHSLGKRPAKAGL